MLDYYLYITTHIYQVFASCTHYTSYSLLNFVHVIVCDFVLAIQDWNFLKFNAKCAWSLRPLGKLIENLIFGRFGFNTTVFEKYFISYSCIVFITYYVLRSFCIKLLCLSKNWFFHIFDQSNLFLDQSKLQLKIWFESAHFDRFSIAVRSIEGFFDRLKIT